MMVALLSSSVRHWRTALLFAVGGLFVPSRASAECGDYITILNHRSANGQPHAMSGSAPTSPPDFNHRIPLKAPCNGPNCSGSPRNEFPPLAPANPVTSRVKE